MIATSIRASSITENFGAKISTMRVQLVLILQEEVPAPSILKSDCKVEFGLGFADELLNKPKSSWCPIVRETQDNEKEVIAHCNLRDLNTIHSLVT